MDRLELYYANPHARQRRGDYVRIRNVFVRSTRQYQRKEEGGVGSQRACRELYMMDRMASILHQRPEASLHQRPLSGLLSALTPAGSCR